MKKLLTLLLVLALTAAAAVSCAPKNPADDSDKQTGVVTPSDDDKKDDETPKDEDKENDADKEDDKDSETPKDDVTDGEDDKDPADKPADKPDTKPEQPEQPEVPSPVEPDKPTTPENPEQPETPETPDEGSQAVDLTSKTLSEIVDLLYEKKPIELRVMTNEIDLTNADMLKYNTGLDSADKIKEAVVSEAMMGSQAYSLVLVRVNDAADAATVAQSMKDGIDTRKWICVEADDLKVGAQNDLVLLIMVDSEYSDMITAADMISAFKELCGGTLSTEL